jgi:hypothetical protein
VICHSVAHILVVEDAEQSLPLRPSCGRSGSITTSRLAASSDAVGSSSSRTGWSVMKPRAMLTRCCSPPENVAGGSDQSFSGRLSSVNSSRARSRGLLRATPRISSGSAATSSADTRGTARRNWLT